MAAFIKDDFGRILIVKKSPGEKIDGGLWTIPGGKVNPDEPLINALKRETKEETNLKVVKYQWLGEDVFISNNKYFHGQHFLCQVRCPKKIILEKNLTEYHWLTEKKLKDYHFHPNINRRLKEIFKNNKT